MQRSLCIAVAAMTLAAAGTSMAAEPSQASLMSQVKVSKAAAERVALAKVPSGTVKSSELEREHGALVWSFDIATPASRDIHEILVDAKTGKIAYTELESPKAQAKEAAADKAEQANAARVKK